MSLRSNRYLLPCAIGLAVVFVAACVTDKVTGEKRFSVRNWTVEDEVSYGRQAAPNIESEYDATYADREANEYLQKLVDELVEHSPRQKDLTWRFRILNTSQKNAFALPGGFVYITRGLLERLKTEGEFVFAIGHEIGHVEHRHAMLMQSKQTVAGIFMAPVTIPVNLVTSVATGPGGGIVAGVGRLITAPSRLLLLRYSRGAEDEADHRGLYFTETMGFDPRDADILFDFFKSEEKKYGGPGRGWLSSHPLTNDRIARVDERIREEYPQVAKKKRSAFRQTSPKFKAILARLEKSSQSYQDYDVAMGYLFKKGANEFELTAAKDRMERAAKTDAEEPLFLVGLGEEAMTRKKTADAKKHFEAAVALYEKRMSGESHWKAHYYLGVIAVGAKQGEAALEHLEKSRDLFPMQPSIYYFLGEAYVLTGAKEKARAAYEKVLELAPKGHVLADKARERLKRI